MKQTKEQLLKIITIIELKLERVTLKDTIRLREFSKAFDWYKPRGQFNSYGEKEPITPSWEQIFVKTGKLLAAERRHNFTSLEGRVFELETKLQEPSATNETKNI